ncbi:MAG: hypothetical protein NPIRA02_29520 [Nitrospirales bacterium]|nr:MAG: hypothetical protein NPIRA02_29520 [Nitrospirales bacterium]
MATILTRLVLSTKQFDNALQQTGNRLTRIWSLANSVFGAAVSAGITSVIKSVSQEAIKFETAFAGVRKTVEATEQEFTKLASNFTGLSERIPVSRNELAKIGEVAGQLGVSGVDNLTKFTDTIAKIAVSTNLTTEQAATEFARFANIVQLPLDQVDRLGSTVVALGNNFATTESEISQFGQRLAGAGATIGLSTGDIIGIGTALSSLGINAEAGGTAFSKVLIKIAADAENGGGAIQEFIGLTADGFRDLVRTNPAEAITTFVEALGRVKDSGGDLFGTLDELGVKEIRLRDALLRSAGAGGLLREAIQSGNDAFRENTALQEEAQKRFSTTESALTTLSNTYEVLQGTIGSALLPAIKDFTAALTPIISGITEWAKENPKLVKGLVAMAGVVATGGALLVGVGALGVALGAFGAAGSVVVGAVAGFAALTGAIVAFGDDISSAASKIAQFIDSGLDDIGRTLSELPRKAFESGIGFVDAFAEGLASRADAGVDAVKSMVSRIRNFLPFSPAKEGPLSDLDKSGEAFGKTFAEGIRAGGGAPVDATRDVLTRLDSELDIRGSIPTRSASGRFNGAVQRTGETFADGLNASLESFVKRANDSFAQAVLFGDAAARSLSNGFEQLFLSPFQHRIESFSDIFDRLGDIAKNVLSDIARELIKIAAIKVPAGVASAFLGGGLGSSIAAAQLRGAGNPALFGPGFLHGGILGPNGKMQLRKLQDGGIARGPSLAMFGEGTSPEAFVPLKDGAIPVNIRGSSTGATTININNYSPSVQATASERTGPGGQKTIEVMIEDVVLRSARYGRLRQQFGGGPGRVR